MDITPLSAVAKFPSVKIITLFISPLSSSLGFSKIWNCLYLLFFKIYIINLPSSREQIKY
jgi:hypothetical protein